MCTRLYIYVWGEGRACIASPCTATFPATFPVRLFKPAKREENALDEYRGGGWRFETSRRSKEGWLYRAPADTYPNHGRSLAAPSYWKPPKHSTHATHAKSHSNHRTYKAPRPDSADATSTAEGAERDFGVNSEISFNLYVRARGDAIAFEFMRRYGVGV